MRSLKIVKRDHGLVTLWTDVRNLWLLISSRLPVCLLRFATGVAQWKQGGEGENPTEKRSTSRLGARLVNDVTHLPTTSSVVSTHFEIDNKRKRHSFPIKTK